MSKTGKLFVLLNALLAAVLIGALSQSSAQGASNGLNPTFICADSTTGILKLPTDGKCSKGSKKVNIGSTTPQAKNVAKNYVRTQSLTVLSSCPWNNFVTDVSYNSYSTYNPIRVSSTRLYCRTVTVVVP